MTKLRSDTPEIKSTGNLAVTGSAFHGFFGNISKKVQNYLESHFRTLKKDYSSTGSAVTGWNNKDSSTTSDANQDKQLQAWKENPVWVDPSPEIKVSVPKGSLCNLNVTVDVGLPPDTIYNIVTDPDNKRVFKNIKEVLSRNVLVDEGLRQVVELEESALWRFLWWSGTISVHVLVDQNRADHSMKFKQIKTGFMKKFEGCWKVEPIFVDEKLCDRFKPKTLEDYITCTKGRGRLASKVSLEQLLQPAIVPPPPISWYLRGITARTTEMIISDLVAEAARLRGSGNEGLEAPEKPSQENNGEDKAFTDVKERWASRRRNSKHSRRRLLTSICR